MLQKFSSYPFYGYPLTFQRWEGQYWQTLTEQEFHHEEVPQSEYDLRWMCSRRHTSHSIRRSRCPSPRRPGQSKGRRHLRATARGAGSRTDERRLPGGWDGCLRDFRSGQRPAPVIFGDDADDRKASYKGASNRYSDRFFSTAF